MALHWKIIVGLVLGIVVGAALNVAWTDATWQALGVGDSKTYLAGKASETNADAGVLAGAARWAGDATRFVGQLFVRCLRFIAAPIVLFSLIAGAASLGDVRKLGRIGGKALGLFAATTVLATVLGVGLTRAVEPGGWVSDETKAELLASRADEASGRTTTAQAAMGEKSAWDRLLEIVPTNPFEALARGEMLQIVMLAITLGCCLTLIPIERSRAVIDVCHAITEAITKFIMLLMKSAPYAVFAIIVPIVATVGLDVLQALAIYSVVVVVGLCIMLFGVYPALLYAFTPAGNKVTFRRFFRAMAPAQLLAFSSSSSNATLPVNMECCRKRLGVSEEVTSFVLPLGATVNMNGTALYLSVVAIFLAQLYDIPLTLGEQAALVLTATLSAVGAAGIPGASIALMVVVLETVHVPPEGIAIILGMDRLLDMCRTVVNVSGDAAAAAIVAGTEGQLGGAPTSPGTA